MALVKKDIEGEWGGQRDSMGVGGVGAVAEGRELEWREREEG